jgi:hypothetical protein
MKGDKNVDNVSNFLSIKLYQDIAQYVLDTGSYTFGIGYNGIDSLTIFINSVKEKFGIFDREVKEFVDFLENKNIIDKVFYIEANAINPQIDGFAYDCEVSIQRIKSFIKNGININEKNIEPSLEKIKSLRLDEKNRLIEINKGERIISFKSRKKEEDSGDEDTKQFKILFYLWDFRWEMRDGKVKQKGDFASLKNLTKNSGCKTEKATYQHIKRLNAVFKKNGLAIKITGENGNFRIVMET